MCARNTSGGVHKACESGERAAMRWYEMMAAGKVRLRPDSTEEVRLKPDATNEEVRLKPDATYDDGATGFTARIATTRGNAGSAWSRSPSAISSIDNPCRHPVHAFTVPSVVTSNASTGTPSANCTRAHAP